MLSQEEIRRRRIWNQEAELWVDEVEYTSEYEEAMETVQPVLDAEFGTELYLGKCHMVWTRKKELLAEMGINWDSPAEFNPDTIFD